MTESDRCSRMADECERLAKRTTSPEDRHTLLNMAQLWRELADTAVTAEWLDELQPGRRPTKHA